VFRLELKKRKCSFQSLRSPLTPEEEKIVEEAWTETDSLEELLSEGPLGQRITRADAFTLKDTAWLNDEVINFYLTLLSEHCKRNEPAIVKCHVFNTFFYPKLLQGYDKVSRWTRKVDIFSMEKIIVPIHLKIHWCLAVINVKETRFEYYDSLGGSNDRVFQVSNHIFKCFLRFGPAFLCNLRSNKGAKKLCPSRV